MSVFGGQGSAIEVSLAQLASALTEALGESIAVATWHDLASIPTRPLRLGAAAKVYGPDDGTHLDPVTGAAGVLNTGIYQAVPNTGWKRVADLPAEDGGPVSTSFMDAAFAMVGLTPGGVRYEMNSPGQAGFDPQILHIAQLGQYLELIEGFRFNDDPKALGLQFGKSRGNGDPASPNFHKRSKQNDRLFSLSTYGSSDATFSHASYWFVYADYPSDNNTEQAAMQHIYSSNAKTNGNGIQINSLAQVCIPGPNQLSFLGGVDYTALLLLGAGGKANGTYDMAPLRFSMGPLTQTPLPGTVEYDGNGHFFITEGLATLDRKRLLSSREMSFAAPIAITGTATMRSGVDFVELTLTPSADFSSPNSGVVRVNTAAGTAFPVIPVVIGSSYSNDINSPEFEYQGGLSRLQVLLKAGTLKAGSTYVFTMMWRLPA